MEFEPREIPEGINTSREHPLREFAVLVSGIAAVIVLVTGLLIVSADFLIGFIPVEQENSWFSSDSMVDESGRDSKIESNSEAEVERYLQNLITQLQDESRPDFRFNVNLIESETPNAFVLPGGNIAVTSGLLRRVESENGLAMVLAHEMAHQYYRHPLRALGRGVVVSLALMVITGFGDGALADSFVAGAVTLTQLSFSREQEREADELGVELLIRHYGHARGAGEFFEAVKLLPDAESDMPNFLSTHPGIDERLGSLRARAAEFDGDRTPLDLAVIVYLDTITPTE